MIRITKLIKRNKKIALKIAKKVNNNNNNNNNRSTKMALLASKQLILIFLNHNKIYVFIVLPHLQLC